VVVVVVVVVVIIIVVIIIHAKCMYVMMSYVGALKLVSSVCFTISQTLTVLLNTSVRTYVRMYVCMNSMPIISAVEIVISELRSTYLSSEQEMKVQTCALMPWASHGPQDGSAVIAWVTPREWSHMVAF
jgi:hypothetical protein